MRSGGVWRQIAAQQAMAEPGVIGAAIGAKSAAGNGRAAAGARRPACWQRRRWRPGKPDVPPGAKQRRRLRKRLAAILFDVVLTVCLHSTSQFYRTDHLLSVYRFTVPGQ